MCFRYVFGLYTYSASVSGDSAAPSGLSALNMNTASSTSPVAPSLDYALDVVLSDTADSLDALGFLSASCALGLIHLPLRVWSGMDLPRLMCSYNASSSRRGPAIISRLYVITDLSAGLK